MTDRQVPKLAGLDALRGLLALWVLVAHVATRVISDGTIQRFHARGILEPLEPVKIFMILSGFVIFWLQDKDPMPYRAFLVRRFFRLMPLYLVTLLAAALLTKFELRTLENLFMRNAHIYDSIKVHQEALANFPEHFWAHLLLLHGLIPDRLLADANYTFISQGWSISLEWQFYLLAPLLFLLIARQRYVALGFVALLLALLTYGWQTGVGFLPNQAPYFALGIASYYAYRAPVRLPRLNPIQHDLVTLFAAALIMLLPAWLPLLVWLVAFDLVMARRAGLSTPLTSVSAWVLVLRWLGEISYSTYLLHILVLFIVFRAITKLAPHIGGWQFLCLALPGTVTATIAIAALTHRWIEQPGIAFGRRWANAIAARTQPPYVA
jgi:peptidoglycan/LPS O-acetylase OafA/YrhL